MVSKKTLAAIFAHAEAEAPKECCGVIVRKGARGMEYLPMDNVHADPENHFQPDRSQYLNIQAEYDVTHIVHSHPGDGARAIFSPADIASCDETGIPYLLVSWPEGDVAIRQPEINKPLVGRQFVVGTQDCYSLVMEWHRRQGIELMDFRTPYPWWERGEDRFTPANLAAAGFVECDYSPGAMIVMQVQCDVPNHCGVLMPSGELLHHLFGRPSGRDIYHGSWLQRGERYCVRHKDLPPAEEITQWL